MKRRRAQCPWWDSGVRSQGRRMHQLLQLVSQKMYHGVMSKLGNLLTCIKSGTSFKKCMTPTPSHTPSSTRFLMTRLLCLDYATAMDAGQNQVQGRPETGYLKSVQKGSNMWGRHFLGTSSYSFLRHKQMQYCRHCYNDTLALHSNCIM
jgi:hypothetical protein